MNGPEHYRQAERLADQAHTVDPEFASYLVANAQVHATLALAAATAQASTGIPSDGDTAAEWRQVLIRPRIKNSEASA